MDFPVTCVVAKASEDSRTQVTPELLALGVWQGCLCGHCQTDILLTSCLRQLILPCSAALAGALRCCLLARTLKQWPGFCGV